MTTARSCRAFPVAALVAVALAVATLIALGAATPAQADTIHRSYVYQGAKYKIEADYNDDDDDGPRGWYLEAEYRGPVNKKKTSYTIPKSFKITYKGKKRTVHVKEIGDRAFYKLTKVKKVTCKANIDSIGDKAFYGCKNLKIFNAPKAAITSVGDRAFYKCKKLTTFRSKNYRINEIGREAFYGCSKLKSLPKLTAIDYTDDDDDDYECEIDTKAFYGCKALKSVTVRLRSYELLVRGGAFENCTALSKVKLEGSDGDVHLSAKAFHNCGKLKTIEGLGKLESLGLRANSLKGTPLYGKVTGFNRNPYI